MNLATLIAASVKPVSVVGILVWMRRGKALCPSCAALQPLDIISLDTIPYYHACTLDCDRCHESLVTSV